MYNVNTLEEFYKMVLLNIKKNKDKGENFQVTLYFTSGSKNAARTFSKRYWLTFESFSDHLERM